MAKVGFIPGKVSQRGEEIYRNQYQREFEANFRGEFVMIDVETEKAYRGATATEAYENARRQSAEGPFYLLKVGEPGAYKIRYSTDADGNRIFR
jgi:hypothetical protein